MIPNKGELERQILNLVSDVAQLRAAGNAVGVNNADVFVFQPGGTTSGKTYASWAALYAAYNSACPASSNGTRPRAVIQVDDSFTSPAVIPAGAYNLDSVTFEGVSNPNTTPGGAALNIATGTTIVAGTLRFHGAMAVTYLGAAACITTGAGECNLFIGEATQLVCSGAGPFVLVNNGVTGFCFTQIGPGGTLGNGANAVINVSVGNGANVLAYGHALVAANAVTGGGTVFWDTSPPGAQGGGVTVTQVNAVFTAGLKGASALPLFFAAGAPFSVAASFALSSAQQAFPSYACTGVVGAGGVTLTLPNTPGATYFFDLTAVTLTGTLTFSAGTGAQTAAVTAANLSATGQKGVIVQVSASNNVVRLS